MSKKDHFSVKSSLAVNGKDYVYYSLQGLEEKGLGAISKLPFSIKVLLEAAIRQFDGRACKTNRRLG
jgi:aconitate hydratase